MRRMTLTAPAAIEATDTDARILRGIAIPYGQTGYTSAGPVVVDAGAIHLPENLRAVKLFREHGRQTPIGYAAEATDGADALRMAFTMARTPDGDQALLEASEGLRDALSVELNNVQLEAGHVVSADLVAVAQVAVPAFAGAQLAATLSDDEQAQVHDQAQAIVDETEPDDTEDDSEDDQPPSEPTGDDTTTEETSMTTQTTEAGARPAGLTAGMIPTGRGAAARADANTSLEVYAAQAVAAIRGGSGTTAELNAALQDIVPENTEDPGGAFLRPAWLGELWSASNDERPFANMVGLGDLTSATFEGWAWTLKPKVSHYAGNKTEVPTSPATAGLVESGPPQRIAGAWDVDRIYVDFNTGMLSSFLEGAVDSYNELLEEDLATLFQGLAVPLEDVATPLAAFTAVVASLVSVGARADYIAMAPDVFATFIGLNESEVPWWLQNQGSISLTGGGSVDVAELNIGVVAGLEAGTVLGGDRRAVDVRATGPIRVEAVNIPNGGIDVGLFGYMNDIVNDGRAVVSTHVTAPVEALSATAKKTTSSSK